jgi:hypothetical protein
MLLLYYRSRLDSQISKSRHHCHDSEILGENANRTTGRQKLETKLQYVYVHKSLAVYYSMKH